MKRFFVSFADSRYGGALSRIQEEARRMDIFNGIFCWNEYGLDAEFWGKHGAFMRKSTRGFGYYIWKGQVVKQALSLIPKNAMLFYADAGCSLNPNGIPRLLEYCDLMEDSESHRLVFQLPGELSERRWTKAFALRRLECESEELLSSPQLVSGIFGVQKTDKNLDFISRYAHHLEDYDLINDDAIIPNPPEFQEHRHDQSIWSLLNKIATPAPVVLRDETYFPDGWVNGYPFHARRWK